MTLPPLPRVVWSPHGDIRVTRPRTLSGDADETVYGEWHQVTRTVRVVARLRRDAAWPVLFHELVHADLDDYGVTLPHDDVERVCDALALARMAWFRRLCDTHGPEAAVSAVGVP